MKHKRARPKAGDLFAVPLCDGSYGLGHIVFYDYAAICAFFPDRANTPERLLKAVDSLVQPLTILTITAGELRSSEWPMLGFREVAYPPSWIPKYGCEGAVSHTSGVAVGFLEAYHGLIPWNEMADPHYYEKKLLPGVPVPSTVRYKRDFAPSARSAPAAPLAPAPQVTEGPAEIHIQILYPGSDLPTVEQVRKRQELERRVEAGGAGQVTDAGGGEGVMDVHLETDEVRRAMPIIERIIAELGLADETLIETGLIEDEDEDEDERIEADEDEHGP